MRPDRRERYPIVFELVSLPSRLSLSQFPRCNFRRQFRCRFLLQAQKLRPLVTADNLKLSFPYVPPQKRWMNEKKTVHFRCILSSRTFCFLFLAERTKKNPQIVLLLGNSPGKKQKRPERNKIIDFPDCFQRSTWNMRAEEVTRNCQLCF